jgi:hypothetical protein
MVWWWLGKQSIHRESEAAVVPASDGEGAAVIAWGTWRKMEADGVRNFPAAKPIPMAMARARRATGILMKKPSRCGERRADLKSHAKSPGERRR